MAFAEDVGALISELKKSGVNEDLESILTEAKEERNYLTHHFFAKHYETMQTDDGREEMLKELQNIRFKVGRARSVISQFNEAFIEHTFGLSKETILAIYEERKRSDQRG